MKVSEGWEIPQLDLEMQATEVIAPVTTWGVIGRGLPMHGTYCFYTDDYRFTAIWKDPGLVVRSGCKVATELNYSTFEDSEPEHVLRGIYRKRVISRYLQLNGIRILVDLDLNPNFVSDFGLIGVPKGWRAYCTRSHRLSQWTCIEQEYDVATEHAETEDILFVVFGGGKKVRGLVEERGWVSVPEHIEVVRGRAEPYGGVTATRLWKDRPNNQEPPP
jgi:hypothetical protein